VASQCGFSSAEIMRRAFLRTVRVNPAEFRHRCRIAYLPRGDRMHKRVGILIFPAVEVLDFCGPYEVFSVTRLDEERRPAASSPFERRLGAQTIDPVVAT